MPGDVYKRQGQGCALLVPLVENGYIDFENKVTRLVLEDYLRPIRESGADTLIDVYKRQARFTGSVRNLR